ncbi:50S ribosomal protein L24 [bacterium]|nr:50S ribosomal protein L24 [bacterium]QQR60294.1 MAG: 50S ribosomal protein L24 [Candidatus Melainabacteria bacterium]
MHVKRGDLVMMISGSEKAGKGKIGKVLKVFPAQGKIIVEGINVIKRATKARPGSMQTQGGIVEKEAPIFACKVQLYDPVAKKPTRIRHKVLENGKKVRVGVKSGEILDN